MRLFLLCFVSILLISCAASRQDARLAEYRAILSKTAMSKMKADDKIEILVDRILEVMHESLDFIDVKKGAKYAENFFSQNEESINGILADYDAEHQEMDALDILNTVLNYGQSDQLQKAIDLVPRFVRKYKQYRFVVENIFKPLGWLGELGVL